MSSLGLRLRIFGEGKPILATVSVFGFLALSHGDYLYWHCTIGILNLYGGSVARFFPSSGFPRIHLVSLVSLFIYVCCCFIV